MAGAVVHTFQTKDGQWLRVRPLRPEDACHLVDLFEHLGPESRYLRFNLALTNPDPELIWSEARRIADIDAAVDGAWLAFADLPNQPDAPVAGVRYVRIAADAAEASLTVRDDMQGRGVGTALLTFLVEQARAAGLRQLVATAQRANRPLWGLLQKSTLPFTRRYEGSSITIEVDISEPETAGVN